MKNKYDWKEVQAFYNTGKSIRECCEHFGMAWRSIQKAILRNEFKTTRSISDAMKVAYKTGRAYVHDLTEKGRESIRQSAIRNELGGKRNSKRFIYKGITLDSSYELRLAKILDKQNIKWIRPTKILWKDIKNVEHRYYPDFYLCDYRYYIDTKNKYLAVKDKVKIKAVCDQNKIRIRIIEIEEIIESEKHGLII
jgi:hypothetical protein